MRLLTGTSLHFAVNEAAASSERVWLVSGFVKSGFLERMDVNGGCDLKVFSRWRLADLLAGASDFKAANETMSKGGSFFIHPRLHAKVFLFDNHVFVGSANLTSSGLPLKHGAGNIEAAVQMAPSKDLIHFVEELQREAMHLDPQSIAEIQRELAECPRHDEILNAVSPIQMPNAFIRRLTSDCMGRLCKDDLPLCGRPADLMLGDKFDEGVAHDLKLFSLNDSPTLKEIRNAFLSSTCFAWLVRETQTAVKFGHLASQLHDALADPSPPKRREVKRLLSNLISWARECDNEKFTEHNHERTTSYKSERSPIWTP
jgi:hypothetical protein